MKYIIPFALTLVSFFAACKNKTKPLQEQQQAETPKALANNNESDSYFSKSRSGSEMVNELYDDLVKKTDELKNLETQLALLSKSKPDSLAAFQNFLLKNTAYYESAKMHINTITDSSLKKNIAAILEKSIEKKNNILSPYQMLIKEIELKTISLTNLYTILKIVKTIPIIEKYQKDELPNMKPIETLNNKYKETIYQVDTITSK